MRVDIGNCRLFFEVEGSKLRPDGPRMKELPTLLLLHGGPGFDHSSYKPAFHHSATSHKSSTSTTVARAVAIALRQISGTSTNGRLMSRAFATRLKSSGRSSWATRSAA
jgi:hypothetical protein